MSQMKIEYVYVLTNRSFGENLIKIGFSDDPKRRAKELHSTSLPHPFEIAYAVPVYRAYELEQLVHKALDDYRVNNDREFFDCGVSMAINTIRAHLPDYSNALTKEVDATFADDIDSIFSVQDKTRARKLGDDAGFKFEGAENPFDWATVNSYAADAGCGDPKVLMSFKDGWLDGLGRREELELLEASKLEELERANQEFVRSAKARQDGSKAFDSYYAIHDRLDFTAEVRHAAAVKHSYQRGSVEYELFLISWDECRSIYAKSQEKQ